MQIAGVRDFRSRATQLLGGKDLVFVTKHGKVTSLVVPMGDAETLPIELRRELLTTMGRSISAHLKEQGVSEAKVLKDFKAWKKSAVRLAADANVLLSAAIGKAAVRVFTAPDISVITCAQVLGEVAEYLPVLGKKYGLAPELLQSQLLLLAVEVCPSDSYKDRLAEATRKLKDRDPDDVELLALALAQGVPVWTNDHDFEGCGVECLSTAKLLKLLDQSKP